MIAHLVTLIELVALVVVIWHALCALNHMNCHTRRTMILAVTLVFASAVARVFIVTSGDDHASLVTAGFAAGIALGMLANRRRTANCPCLPSWPQMGSSHDDKEIHV